MSDEIRPASDEELAEYLALHRKEDEDGYWNCDLDANITVRQLIARIEQDRATIAAKDAEIERLTNRAVQVHLDLEHKHAMELTSARAQVETLREALTRLRDCDWSISLPDRMDAVRDIARAALASTRDQAETRR